MTVLRFSRPTDMVHGPWVLVRDNGTLFSVGNTADLTVAEISRFSADAVLEALIPSPSVATSDSVYPWVVDLPMMAKVSRTNIVPTATGQITQNSGAFRGGYRAIANLNDYAEWDVNLGVGCYQLVAEVTQGDGGTVEVDIDGVPVATIDTYGTPSGASRRELGTIDIAKSGVHQVRVTVIGKNTTAGATTYVSRLCALTFARVKGAYLPRLSDIPWTYRAQDMIPHSIGVDGWVYGHQYADSRTLVRSGDGGVTLDVGRNMGSSAGGSATTGAGEYVSWCTRTTEGYVVVTSTDVSVAGNSGSIFFSTSFTGPYTKVQALRGINEFSISKPEIGPNGKTLLMVGEYSTDSPQPTHDLYLSQDGGQTWTKIKTATVNDSSKNSHYHAAVYDPSRQRIWSSQGDNQNSTFSYSDNFGSTWTNVLMPTTHPLYFEDQMPQPTVLVSFATRLCSTPDRANQLAGVWATDPDGSATVSNPALKWASPRAEQSQGKFGRSPYVQSADGKTAVLWIPDSINGNKFGYFVGTGDAGLSWHLLHTLTQAAMGNSGRGVVGPDRNGLIFFRSIGNVAPWGDNLMTAPLPTFYLPVEA